MHGEAEGRKPEPTGAQRTPCFASHQGFRSVRASERVSGDSSVDIPHNCPMDPADGLTLGRRSRRLRSLVKPSSWLLLGSLLIVGIPLHVYGRWSASDRYDLLAVPGSVAFGWLAWRLAKPSLRLAWTGRIGAWLRRAVAWGNFDVGLDLRGTPPLRSRHPWRQDALVGGLVGLGLVLAATLGAWPGGVRESLRNASGVLSLGFTTLVWAALVPAWFVAVAGGVGLASERFGAGDRRVGRSLGLLVFAILVTTAFWPGELLVGLLLVCAFVHWAALGWMTRRLRLVWYPSPHGGPAWTSLWAVGVSLALGVPAVVWLVGALGAGGALFGDLRADVAWTQWAGRGAFGACVGLAVGVFTVHLADTALCYRADPGREPTALRRTPESRRAFLQETEALLALVRVREYERGCGFLIAPHLWFVDGVSRDVEEESQLLDRVGPLFRRHYSHGARGSFLELARELELDLLFVEDGVLPVQLREVLERLYAFRDDNPGTPLSEVRTIQPPTGLAVILQEFDFGSPWVRTGFPQPEFDEIMRARLLYVFRERGGEDELAPVGDPGTWEPALSS